MKSEILLSSSYGLKFGDLISTLEDPDAKLIVVGFENEVMNVLTYTRYNRFKVFIKRTIMGKKKYKDMEIVEMPKLTKDQEAMLFSKNLVFHSKTCLVEKKKGGCK